MSPTRGEARVTPYSPVGTLGDVFHVSSGAARVTAGAPSRATAIAMLSRIRQVTVFRLRMIAGAFVLTTF